MVASTLTTWALIWTFSSRKVELFPDRIYLTPNKVFDESGNEGWVKGNIYHTAYDHFVFDSLVFNSGNFVLMNATVKENPDFYGYTSGQVNAVIDGPLEDLQVTVDATPVKTPGKANVVYIPAYGSGNVSRHNFIQFVDRSDSTGQAENNNKSLSVVSVSTFVQVTPDVEVQILLSSERFRCDQGSRIRQPVHRCEHAWKSGDQRLAKDHTGQL